MLFRRATHDRHTGEYIAQKFDNNNMTHYMKKVWDAHGHIVHLMSSKKPMSFQDILNEIRKDVVNYDYRPTDFDLVDCHEGSPLPSPKDVALAIIRCIEAGFIEVVEN